MLKYLRISRLYIYISVLHHFESYLKLDFRQFMGVGIDEKYGGVGSTFFVTNIMIEELAKVDMAVSILVDVQNALINTMIIHHGTTEQRDKYLPQLATNLVSKILQWFGFI